MDNYNIEKSSFSDEEIKEHERFIESLKGFLLPPINLVCSFQAGILLIDAHTHKIIDVNPTALKMIGLPKEKVVNQICHKFVCPAEEGKCPITNLNQVLNNTEKTLLQKDGKEIPILKTAVWITLNGRECLVESFLDISLQKENEEKLGVAKLEAEIANHTKSKFLANMSHEIRRPLNSIIGFSEILLYKNEGQFTEKQVHYINNILKSGKYLLELINQILDLSKVEAGKMELSTEDFEFEAVINDVNIIISPLAMKKGINLNYNVSPEVGVITADRTKLKQILFNLLSNSIKFTPSGGNIDVKVTSIEDGIQVQVSDTGIGIKEDDLETIFEPFKQLENASDSCYAGTGLGLPLVKNFVELHGGTTKIESEVGKGTTFYFTIPQNVK
ncbi:PAS domain-containing sensor histidine kinase [Methanohalophilus sp.]|uniref:PAS domain-containing sensor histidine kinase n=1 Tax=Methanohalophilus sp. TaxID=1966352 RepID=UPI0026041327|nr:PAS domain-containing sensor histidine kinase [Methanohalophilus sp.]MDK2892738.1 hypothetical protein [Methanohalophilus sp.]